MERDFRVLCVAPLMAREPLSSHALYIDDIRAALARRAPGLQVDVLPLPARDGESRFRRIVVQYRLLPGRLRARLSGLAGERVVLHLLDQHYAYLRQPGIPCVLTCNGVFRRPALVPRIARFLYRTRRVPQADRIIAVSREVKAELQSIFGVSPTKVSVCHYGVDPVFRPSEPAAIRGRAESVLLLHVGSNLPQKNLPTLLRAMRIALDRGLDLKLVKVGDAIDRSPYGPLVEELGLGARILFLGKLAPAELARVYSACDLFVFPSSYEGFGRPISEAQACGIPCILAARSCLPEIGGGGALYHAAFDAAEMATRILQAAGDDVLRASLVHKGFANARRFSWDRHADGLLEAYQAALALGAPRGAESLHQPRVAAWLPKHRS